MSETASASGPLIDGIPLALWIAVGVAVLSAIVTLVGVVLSNWNSRRNLREQLTRGEKQFAEQLAHDSQQLERRLAHEADQRDRERQMSLRREVYLEAAAALAHANALIGRLTNIENDQKTLGDEFAADVSKISKIHIVGSPKTIEAVVNFLAVLGPSFMELVQMRVPLMTRKAAIDLEGTFLDAALAERKRFTAMMQQLNLDSVTDPARWDPVRRQSEFAAETHASHAATQDKLGREQVKGTFALVRHAAAIAEKLGRLYPPALLAVRSEMDLPLDPEWYQSLMSAQLANMRIATERVLASMEQSTQTPSEDADSGK